VEPLNVIIDVLYFGVKWFNLHILLNQMAAIVLNNFSFVFL